MKLFARILSLLLCLALSIPMVISCGDDTETPDDNNASDQNGMLPSDDQNNTDDEVDNAYPHLTVKNRLAFSPVAMRTYYPDHNALLTRLMQIKNAAADGTIADDDIIRSELIAAIQMAENLGIYYDYYNHTSYVDGDNVYGAQIGEYPIGGGSGYAEVKKVVAKVKDDDSLNKASAYVGEGEIIMITEDAVIDLADYILAGDSNGFAGGRIEFDWKIADGAAWVGTRGVDGGLGAILKMTSYTDCTIIVGKNARLSGLVIQGPDLTVDASNDIRNLSIGIVVNGDGAVIENCEISGFGRIGVQVTDAKDVLIRNCYFHDMMGETSGYAVSVNNSSVEMYGNLFSSLTTLVAVEGADSVLDFHDNMDAGNITGPYFRLFQCQGKEADFPAFRLGSASVSIQNNTFLSLTDLFKLAGLPLSLTVQNNLFAYPEFAYNEDYYQFNKVDGKLFDSRVQFKNNVFDITAPLVLSKSSSAKLASENELLGAYSTVISDKLKAFEIAENASANITYTSVPQLPVLSALYYSENDDKGYAIIRDLIASNLYSKNQISNNLITAISAIGGYSNYLQYDEAGLITLVVDGQRYGAYSEGDVIGGGYNYSEVFTTGDYIVTTEDELVAALKKAKSGEVVFIPGGTYINVSDCGAAKVRSIVVPAGVTLASDRGRVKEDGTVSTGAVIASSYNAYPNDYTIKIGGEGARVTGVVLKGPDPAAHVAHHTRAGTIPMGSNYYYQITTVYGVYCAFNNCEFDNIEIAGYNTCAFVIENLENPVTGTEVHHTYTHHNQLKGLGYGVRVDFSAVNITYNMFNYNRHSIASGGAAQSSYSAENNIEMGNSLDHFFDVHGGKDRKDGTNIAGGYVYIRNNSFLGNMRPFAQRGLPEIGQDFSYNVVYLGLESCGSTLGRYGMFGNIPLSTVGSNIWDIQNGNKTPVTGNGFNY